jgi:TrmH family RNA methyltransferase
VITLRKLGSLEPRTRVRKSLRLLEEAVLLLRRGEPVDSRYYASVCRMVEESEVPTISTETRKACACTITLFESGIVTDLLWSLSDTVHLLMNDLGMERADWDFIEIADGSLDALQRTILPFTVVLDRIRSPFNTGSMFRTADSFGVSSVLLVEPSASPEHPRAQRSGRGCTETVLWRMLEAAAVRSELEQMPVFALELGGIDCAEFPFPREGAVIIGSEELGVSPEMLELADASLGRVSIPLAGSKGSLNVSVAFGILMHQWFSRVSEQDT